jgi:hypothetical protein
MQASRKMQKRKRHFRSGFKRYGGLADLEEPETITTLKNTTNVLARVVKSNCLPANLEIEVCNLRYDFLSLICKLQKATASEEDWLCP